MDRGDAEFIQLLIKLVLAHGWKLHIFPINFLATFSINKKLENNLCKNG